jgi:hypothetical protein
MRRMHSTLTSLSTVPSASSPLVSAHTSALKPATIRISSFDLGREGCVRISPLAVLPGLTSRGVLGRLEPVEELFDFGELGPVGGDCDPEPVLELDDGLLELNCDTSWGSAPDPPCPSNREA